MSTERTNGVEVHGTPLGDGIHAVWCNTCGPLVITPTVDVALSYQLDHLRWHKEQRVQRT